MNTGSVLAQFTITISKAVTEPVSVDWFTSDGTAKAGVDYAANSGVALFAPGDTEKKVDILVYGRAVGTEDRSFFVEMLPPTNAILGASIGECIIHVDISGSQPVTQIIVPTGPQGLQGKSAYQSWLDTGHSGTEADFLEWLKPDAATIAEDVAPLIDVGDTTLTAQGTESLATPDMTTVKAVARRVAYAGAAKIATVTLADGDNTITTADLTGDAVDFYGAGFMPRVLSGTSFNDPDWELRLDGKITVFGATAGDVLYAVQYEYVSDRVTDTTETSHYRKLRSFEKGSNSIRTATDALLWEGATGGQGPYFVWQGVLPKFVPSGSTPMTTGGIADGAWLDVGNATLRGILTNSNPDMGANIPIYNQDFTGSVPRSVADKLHEHYSARDVNILGDGSDERDKLITLINNRNGRRIDLMGKTVSIASNISLELSSPLEFYNGVINYTGPMAPYVMRLYTTSSIRIDRFSIKGNSNAAKLLFGVANENTATFEAIKFHAEKAKETAGTGLAAGIYLTSDTGKYWDKILVDNVSVYDVENDGTGSNVGRGILLQNFRLAIVNRLDVRRVAPYQDADGIYAASPNYPDANFIIDDCYFEDCQKRSVKSQIMNSRVSNIVERRTQAFMVGPGQSAVDLQAGGSLDGLSCFYADGAAPQSIVAGGFISGATTFRGLSLRNIDVNCEDSTDVISRMVSFFNNSAATYDGYVAENIKCNAIIENLGYLYSSTGNSNPNTYIFKEVIFRNIQASGMAGTTSAAVIQISRGAAAYVKAVVRVLNCNLGDGNTAPLFYLDPAPGVTSFLEVLYRQVANSRGFDTRTPVNSDTNSRIYVQERETAENEAATMTIPVNITAGRTAVKVSVMYNSNRDTQAAKLFTEGYWFYGIATPYYIESVTGVKTQTNVGTISIGVSGNSIVVNKTAGTTAAGGRLTVFVEHVSVI